ncbi:hypothetical protein [Staphylococcus felis]|uniref:hypothetical protein n=1 Tax=Staphylococcus felis TaxID=46127 RepID=UPI000E39EF2A|nr:hypothetical protein [Staphylococcus felis]REI07304.1 hypothetical protein DOS69_05930 [Staphylococcus felis]
MNKKYELDFKLKLINEYKEEKLGYRLISRKYNLDPSLLKHGFTNLIPSILMGLYPVWQERNIQQMKN